MHYPIVYISDGRNADLLRRSMRTVVHASLGMDISFFILSPDESISTDIPAKILPAAPILKDLGIDISNYKDRKVGVSLLRLAIPYIPDLRDYDRILFVDSDTLITDAISTCSFKDYLITIFGMDVSDSEILLSPDQPCFQDRNSILISNELEPSFPDIALSLNSMLWARRGTRLLAYGNGGVALWNNERIRANGIEWYKCRLAYLNRVLSAGKFLYVDQDFSNVMMEASPRISGIFDYVTCDAHPSCVTAHYAGGYKSAIENAYSGVIARWEQK